ncbi:MAG: tRNA (adenosine(37)-N6)-dimethylallyltransferase MiaA [Candidatus Omnitrophica bacterium]|nr:tRNA (adenosine(37)-N6)-dimethylallyltransferase MiaA [Candidatus Omnitrophota bacterium]
MRKKKVIFLVGPTASGKSEAAVMLAKKINTEIISCDSMQVYKGMNIGTSKIKKDETRGITHHLIDVIEPDEEFNVAIFRDKVNSLIEKIHRNDRVPLLVGGSGLYMKILLDGIFDKAGEVEGFRERIEKEARGRLEDYLYRKLKEVDPVAADSLHPKDKRRIIRALEVYYHLGIPISEAKEKRKGLWEKHSVLIFGLTYDRQELYERINKRVDFMFEAGLLDEVKNLVDKFKLSRTAKNALGYKELMGFLEGEYSLDEAKRLIKRNTRRYAKRQLTWFKKEPRIEWITISEGEGYEEIAAGIYAKVKNEI